MQVVLSKFFISGTTNLLTENESSISTDLTGFNAYGSGNTLTRETNPLYCENGSAAIKCVTDGNSGTQGYFLNNVTGLTANKMYTTSMSLCGSGTVVIIVEEYNGAAWIQNTTSSPITLTSSPLRYSVKNTMTANGNNVNIDVVTSGQQSATIYGSKQQFELGDLTSWIPGGSTRNDQCIPVYVNHGKLPVMLKLKSDSTTMTRIDKMLINGIPPMDSCIGLTCYRPLLVTIMPGEKIYAYPSSGSPNITVEEVI